MKNLFSLFFIGMISILIISCESISDKVLPEPDLSLLEDEVEIYRSYEDVDNITLEVMQENGLGARVINSSQTFLCQNPDVKVDKLTKKIIIDFGTGCTSAEGIIRKGKVLLTYSGNLALPGSTIITSFEGYEVNGLKLEGTRILTNTGLNLATSTITMTVKVENGKITWPDNTFATLKMNQVREIKLSTQGYETSVTGTGEGKSRGDYNYSTLITTPLKLTQTCIASGIWVPNSGVLQFTYKGIKSSVDYGSGTCDKVGTVTYPGGSKDITFD
ncbi:MAG: hypothetical protein PSV36_03045 [Algoriphagus sp.]|nr:hypothetical protein [Algoriphagus sp.]